MAEHVCSSFSIKNDHSSEVYSPVNSLRGISKYYFMLRLLYYLSICPDQKSFLNQNDRQANILLALMHLSMLCPTTLHPGNRWGFEICKVQMHHLLGMPVGQIPTFSPTQKSKKMGNLTIGAFNCTQHMHMVSGQIPHAWDKFLVSKQVKWPPHFTLRSLRGGYWA